MQGFMSEKRVKDDTAQPGGFVGESIYGCGESRFLDEGLRKMKV